MRSRSWIHRKSIVLAAAALAAAAAPTSAAAAAEPTAVAAPAAAEPAAAPAAAGAASVESLSGFGGLAFGAGAAKARELWPSMQVLHNDVKMPAAAFTSPHLTRFVLRQHTVSGLPSPVDVELRFWDDKLWAFLVYFEKDDLNAVLQYLEKTYGKRTSGIDTRPIWHGEKVTLQAMGEGGWYGATDNAISEEARAWFFKELTGDPHGQHGDQAQPAPAQQQPAAKAAGDAATPGPPPATPSSE